MSEYPEHKEDFDVVMMKDGVSELTAKPEDFKRVSVTAKDPIDAQTSETVQKEMKGYRVLFAVPPGVMSDPEIHARRRTMDFDTVDKSKL